MITFLIGIVILAGLKVVKPNEALVLTLFGKYYGTLKEPGFFYVNPFVSAINPTMEGKDAEASMNPDGNTNIVLGGKKKDSASGSMRS